MPNTDKRLLAVSLCVMALVFPAVGEAEVIKASCTGMLNFDKYTIDTDLPTQIIEIIGESTVLVDAESILLTGDFGEYRFDRTAGTLYHNDSDTGVYCTYTSDQD